MIRHFLKVANSNPPLFYLRVESVEGEYAFRRHDGVVECDGWKHTAWLGKGTAKDGPEKFATPLGTHPTLAAALAAAKDELGLNVDEPTPIIAAKAAGEVDD